MKASKAPERLPYEELVQFNQHCQAALELIEAFARRRMISHLESRYYRAMLKELRACTSQTVIEKIDQHELTTAAEVSKERLTLEKRLIK